MDVLFALLLTGCAFAIGAIIQVVLLKGNPVMAVSLRGF